MNKLHPLVMKTFKDHLARVVDKVFKRWLVDFETGNYVPVVLNDFTTEEKLGLALPGP